MTARIVHLTLVVALCWPLAGADWKRVFTYDGSSDWREQWFLDGLKARVEQAGQGLALQAGPVRRENASHAVLWTRRSFVGDIKVTYDFTPLDAVDHDVILLYLQATGTGQGPYAEDIWAWRKLREVPAMNLYYRHMNLLSLSYANYNQEQRTDYIRARRYPVPEGGNFGRDTEVPPTHFGSRLFHQGVTNRITVVKTAERLRMRVETPDGQAKVMEWDTSAFPPVIHGRIGLRHMWTRKARYENFQVFERDRAAQIRETLFVPDPLPELAGQTHGSFEPEPGVRAERVSYATQFGLRVPAILYLPEKRSGKIPGLVLVNGHGGDKYSWYSFYTGILYARAGVAVLTYDQIGEGERNIGRESGTRAHDRRLEPEVMGRRMGGLMVTDVMQAVSYLRARPEVDRSRIGAMGHSMGSFVLTLAGAVDRRIRAVVLSGGGNLDGPEGYWDNSKPMCQGIPYRSLSFLGDRPAMLFALHAERGPTLIYNGDEDEVVRIPTVGREHLAAVRQRAIALHGSENGVFDAQWLAGASHRPFMVTMPVALWLEKQLDFPEWTEEEIRSMPVTHISEWAAAEGVELDPLYAGEHRSGGTMALGQGVPGLRREQLNVLPREEWERRKDEFIYQQWVKRARRK